MQVSKFSCSFGQGAASSRSPGLVFAGRSPEDGAGTEISIGKDPYLPVKKVKCNGETYRQRTIWSEDTAPIGNQGHTRRTTADTRCPET